MKSNRLTTDRYDIKCYLRFKRINRSEMCISSTIHNRFDPITVEEETYYYDRRVRDRLYLRNTLPMSLDTETLDILLKITNMIQGTADVEDLPSAEPIMYPMFTTLPTTKKNPKFLEYRPSTANGLIDETKDTGVIGRAYSHIKKKIHSKGTSSVKEFFIRHHFPHRTSSRYTRKPRGKYTKKNKKPNTIPITYIPANNNSDISSPLSISSTLSTVSTTQGSVTACMEFTTGSNTNINSNTNSIPTTATTDRICRTSGTSSTSTRSTNILNLIEIPVTSTKSHKPKF